MVDPLHLSIALGPLAVYCLLLGMINVSSRPFLTTGARDVAALGVAVSGLVIAGPMELFLPEVAAWKYGPYVWLLLLAFYSMCLTLLVLLMRPRIVIYNVTVDQLRPILNEVIRELDPDARWAGECLVIPKLGVQLHLDSFSLMKNAQLVSAGGKQNYGGWRRVEIELAKNLQTASFERNPYGFGLLFVGISMVSVVIYCVINDGTAVANALKDMLRL